jgi:hypothetical protein
MTQQMFDDMPADPTDDNTLGLIGARQLLAVQTFDIARLTTYPVPIVPGTFVAVSGEGPKGDSNGSGKTSFLAAVSLLHGESQWRLDSDGGRFAAGLLFQPDAAGVSAEANYSPADHGYIVGVFAEPVSEGWDAEDALAHLEATAITVWLRLSATPKYLRVRWALGLHVADGDTDLDRFEQADRLWAALPDRTELGSQKMTTALYGDAPRCMAYLDTTLRPSSPSLLSQQMTEMTPDRIGEALIALTGRETLLDQERETRRKLAEQQIGLREQERANADIERNEDAELEGVAGRDRARAFLDEGERLWHLHHARGYLDAVAAAEAADTRIGEVTAVLTEATGQRDDARTTWDTMRTRTDLADAESRAQAIHSGANTRLQTKNTDIEVIRREIATLTRDRNLVQPLAATWSKTPVSVLEGKEAEAREEVGERRGDTISARRTHATAEQAVRDARSGSGGDAGQTLAALAAAGITGAVLLDQVSLAASARTAWEPRLYRYRDAVVIAPEEHSDALRVLAAYPGATLVRADAALGTGPGPLPDGVVTDLPIAGFLAALEDRYTAATGPDRSVDEPLGETVLGGFTVEIAGRAARIATAEAALADATRVLGQAEEALRMAGLAHTEILADLDAGRAADQVLDYTQTINARSADLAAAEAALPDLQTAVDEAWAIYLAAAATRKSHDTEVALAKAQYDKAEAERARAAADLAAANTARDRVPLQFWRTRWPGSTDEATALLAAQPTDLRHLVERSFRHRASEALKDAMSAYQTGGIELSPELAAAAGRRQQMAEGEPGVAGWAVDFTSIAQPLRNVLDGMRDRDLLRAEQITTQRAKRAEATESLQTEVDRLLIDTQVTQGAVAENLTLALRNISASLDRLNRARGGFGAELLIENEPPTEPTVPWKWKVTPRWRRSPTGKMISYREVANGAQVKVFAIQLVLAALLAGDGAAGRMLVLDELGNSLGDANRRDVLADLHDVARDMNLTILGTCQDSVIRDAAGACGEILWFAHEAYTDVFNQPTRAWGFDPAGARVRIVADWLRAGRGLV